jgi:tetratricopeptide (TPR) repeat protein
MQTWEELMAAVDCNPENHTRVEHAVGVFEKWLTEHERQQGAENADVARYYEHAAYWFEDKGEESYAEPFYRKALKIRENVLGAEHPELVTALTNLAIVCQETGEQDEAEQLFRRALTISEKHNGLKSSATGYLLWELAVHFFEQGRIAECEPFYRKALEIAETGVMDKQSHGIILETYAEVLRKLDRVKEAEVLESKMATGRK